MRVGYGYRQQLAGWIDSRPQALDCLEITAEHFYGQGRARLSELAIRYPLYVHGLGLSLGTPGELDARELEAFSSVARLARAQWVSEHVAFTRAGGIDLGHLNPLACSAQSLAVMVEHAQQLSSHCELPLILENVTSHLELAGTMKETEFLNRLCAGSGCGLLLDVTNLFINARNHGYSELHWLREIEPAYITQLHIIGYALVDGRYEDHHSAPIQEELLSLLSEVCDYARVKAVIIEWDGASPGAEVLDSELRRVRSACGIRA